MSATRWRLNGEDRDVLVNWRQIADLLVDPVDHDPLSVSEDGKALRSANREFPLVDDQPVLLADEPLLIDGWVFPPVALDEAARPRPAMREIGWGRRLRSWLRARSELIPARASFVELVRGGPSDALTRILVVGGASVGEGSQAFVDDAALEVISFDVYPTVATTLVGDGHRIPIRSASVDAVWVQAVLEHVYRPSAVVAEIARVLRPGGLVYAETPFLQPVHEGAYDYARFTQSGHRMLFAGFDTIDSGPIGGPAAAGILAVRAFVAGATRSRAAGKVAYACMLPLLVLDRVIPDRFRSDSATGTYFLGRLRPERDATSFDPMNEYRGAQ